MIPVYDRSAPFNDLPDLPPLVDIETKEVLRRAIESNKALAELKGKGNLIPDQNILIAALILQESKDSSEIENIVTTQDALYKAAGNTNGGTSADSATKEVIRYREAMWSGFNALQEIPFSTNLFIKVMQEVRGIQAGIRSVPGIRIADSLGNVVYTPPDGEQLIREKLSQLEKYMHANDETDPLIKAALFHYQFEAIHPFSDGNGRTGRILTILYMVSQGLLELPVLYLSRYILANRKGYYEGLRAVTEQGAWTQWVLYMLKAIEQTAIDTRLRIEQIDYSIKQTIELTREKAGNAYTKDLIELIFRYPYCKIKHVEQAGIAKRATASKYLKALEQLGILEARQEGNEIYYVNVPLMEILTAG